VLTALIGFLGGLSAAAFGAWLTERATRRRDTVTARREAVERQRRFRGVAVLVGGEFVLNGRAVDEAVRAQRWYYWQPLRVDAWDAHAPEFVGALDDDAVAALVRAAASVHDLKVMMSTVPQKGASLDLSSADAILQRLGEASREISAAVRVLDDLDLDVPEPI
jgi:acetylornithine deacetylase/succinyl-diaminopimelate desuccinylase-like protein